MRGKTSLQTLGGDNYKETVNVSFDLNVDFQKPDVH
jgi:hypothetical protein